MKRILLVCLLLVTLAPNLHSQVSPRRGPVGDPTMMTDVVPGATGPDGWDLLRARLKANASLDPSNRTPHLGALVPASQLSVPPNAMKEFQRSQKALRSGDVQGSTAHLQKAIRFYPNFIDAHNALGIHFLQAGEYQKALAEHETALAVDSHVAPTHQALALALLVLKRPQESEAEAREAIDLDPQTAGSRYLLARALIDQGRVTHETIDMLRQAEDAVPNASLVLAQIYFSAGQNDQVVAALRRYLRTPQAADNKLKAECWVAQLTAQPLPAGCPTETTRPSFN